MTMAEQKKALRQAVREAEKQFTKDYLQSSDESIFRRVTALPEVQNAKTVFCYVSVRNEPDTHKIIYNLLEAGKKVCVPLCEKGGVMHACHVTELATLQKGVLDIPAPDLAAPRVSPADIDVVLAPCMAASRGCERLGHGGGYYDRFLAEVRCPVVCLCRGGNLYDFIPCGKYDILVDMVVSEEDVFRCGR